MLPVPALALRADHRRALADAAKRLAEVRRPQTNGTVNFHLSMWWASSAGVSTFGLVDVVDAERFEESALGEVADAGLAMTGWSPCP